MRIGIDGGCLSNRRGFGRFARELLRALAELGPAHEVVVLVDEPSLTSGAVAVPEPFATVAVPVRVAPSRAATAGGSRGLGDLLAMSRAAAGAGLDLLYFPATYSYFPVWGVPRVVVTVFDTMALDFPKLIFPNWRGRLFWTLKERAAVRRACRVVTTSEASRGRIRARFGVGPDRVSVVPCAPSATFFPRPPGLESDAALFKYGLDPTRPFFLYVGGLSPHKNLVRLVEAFARVGRRDAMLALVGDLGDVFHTHVPELREAVARHGLGGRVVFPGFVPDDALASLYSRCVALVQPSLVEGFGLPPVEAMACGAPVLASTAGSLPEVVADAGRLFDPHDVGAMAAAMADVLHDPAHRADLAARARARASAFTWDACARGVVAAWEAEAAPPRPHPHAGPHRRSLRSRSAKC